MKLLIATTHTSVIGGVETYLRALLPMLRQSGYELGLVSARRRTMGRAAIDDLCPGLPSWIASSAAEVMAVARAWQPDAVYTHQLPNPDAETALAVAFPTVAYVHDYAGTCISGNKCHGFPSWKPCARRLGPGCLGVYLPRRCGGLNPVTAFNLYQQSRRRQWLLPRYRFVLVASLHMSAELRRNGSPAERIIVNPYFPPTMAPDSDPPKRRSQSGQILFIGRLTATKGWRNLLEALPKASSLLGRSLTLVVAGDGPDRPAFESKAIELNAKGNITINFLGWVGSEQRSAEMRASDVLAIPSVWPEPFGIVGIEAGCVGLPAVGYAVGGISDWLSPGVSGELAPGEQPDPQGFAAALVRALADEAHWQRLRVNAWKLSHRFAADAHLKQLAAVFEAAISGTSNHSDRKRATGQ